MLNYPKQFQKIKLIYTKKDGTEEEYASKVVNMDSDADLTVENPNKGGENAHFLTGTKLFVRYLVPNIGVHNFSVEITDKIRDNKIVLLKLKRTSTIENLQRRNYYRIKTNLSVDVRKQDDVIVERTILLDISGGGLRFLSKQDFFVNQIVSLNFTLYETDLNLEAKVVKIEKNEDRKNEVSVEFIDLYEDEQNLIVKYVFEVQRTEIKRRNSLNEE